LPPTRTSRSYRSEFMRSLK